LPAAADQSTTIPTQPVQPTPTADTRAAALEAQMTQAEKLALVEDGVNLTYGYTVPLGAGGFVPGNAVAGWWLPARTPFTWAILRPHPA
jgi:hypothetical protein